jgi:8-amino-3,8-dideoxy-alpha-D-manno-octulosonate transaminase
MEVKVMKDKLAIDGGPKAVKGELPGIFHGGNDIGKEEMDLVKSAIERGYLFRYYTEVFGGFESIVSQFEKEVAEYSGVNHAHAVSSGTEAIKSALIAHEVGSRRDGSLHPEDEVIVPVYTFVSSSFAVAAVGARTVIADLDDALMLDADDVEKRITRNTRVIMPVHMRGLPCNMEAIMDVAKKHGIPVMEDTAQAFGASYRGRKLGTFGTGAFSMQYFKNVTSGEGGVVLTDDDILYDRVQMASDTSLCWRPGGPEGRYIAERYEHELFAVPGMGDYRMSEIAGAMALGNFRKLDQRVENGRRNKRMIMKALEDLELDYVPCNDPDGALGIALLFYCPDVETTRKVVAALQAEGVRAAHLYHDDIPDWHVGFHWKPVFVAEREKYRSYDRLRRTVHIDIMPQDTQEHCMMQAEAIRKVALAYLR